MSPYRFPDGTTVQNEGERSGVSNGTSYGPSVTLLRGLQESINTVYIDMTMSTKNGAQKIRDTAVKMGIPDKPSLQAVSGIALGSAPVSPIDIANGYSTVANGGMEHPWYVVQKVTDAQGHELWSHQDQQTQALTPQVAADVSYAMQQVVAGGTGVNALQLGRPAAGKTGTATDTAGDIVTSWFSGFTPQVATAVMYVRGNGRQPINGYLPSYFGADFPTRTWTQVMQQITKDMPKVAFPAPGNVQPTDTSGTHLVYVPPPPSPSAQTATPDQTPPAPTDTTQPQPQPQPQVQPQPQQGQGGQQGLLGGVLGGIVYVGTRRRRR
jgi:membrane peptidoglycan carboxypeptidase